MRITVIQKTLLTVLTFDKLVFYYMVLRRFVCVHRNTRGSFERMKKKVIILYFRSTSIYDY